MKPTIKARALVATAAALALAALAPARLLAQDTAPKAAGSPLRLEDVMPAQSWALVSVPDLQGAKAAFDKTQLAKVRGEFAAFRDALLKGLEPQIEELKGEFARNAGMPLESLLQAFGGGLQVGLMGMDQQSGAPQVVAAIRMDGREEAVRALIAAIERQTQGRQGPPPFTHQGKQVKNLIDPPLYWAEAGSVLLLTLLPDDMKRVLDAAAKPAAGAASNAATLRQSETFAKARAMTAQSKPELLSVYVNFEPLMGMLKQQMPPEQQKIVSTLGGDNLKALDVAITFDGELMASRLLLLAPVPGERPGVLGLFQHGAADTTLARFAPKNAGSAAIGNFDFGKMWDRALDLVKAVDPNAHEHFDRQIRELEKELGFSPRKDLLGSLGNDWVGVGFAPKSGGLPVAVGSVSMKNADAHMKAMTALAKALHTEIATLEMSGKTYRYLRTPLGELGRNPFEDMERNPEMAAMQSVGAALGQSWVVEGGRLYFADMPHSLADYFDAMAAGGTLADAEGWKRAAATLPKGAQMVAWQDPQNGFGGGYNLVIRILKAFEGFARQAGVPLDLNRLPRASELAGHMRPGFMAITIDNQGVLAEAKSLTGGVDAMVVGAAIGGIVAGVAVPNIMEAKKAGNESAAIASLRTITTAQMLYREADKDGNGVADFAPSLRDLAQARLVMPELGMGVRNGYFFTLTGDAATFKAEAHPIEPGSSGDRYFFVDETGVIRYDYWQPAGPESPALGG